MDEDEHESEWAEYDAGLAEEARWRALEDDRIQAECDSALLEAERRRDLEEDQREYEQLQWERWQRDLSDTQNLADLYREGYGG